ncbi:MAG TPA: tripartite tricarboxylate transporter substrate-binding protein [Hypericibacter adhaerens]|jgi:tripartite-type tricarboxylate transporter receptor subunit TctC|uniref:Exported protein n=1 Tax=Hypericibacter adhaerens TaxID=2602016 RepID=A0A5J6MZ41_9PROT|nr:tripartite tricarboxylate transporter substrate-binding protein [Hypericibacter adhaerens]QEX22233.1 exported protein [Hypericibacter adhaerens]HWA43944.1 tripartite tricarboxylate transporter substrate-binding protein [Hypericibacter adhaerens]
MTETVDWQRRRFGAWLLASGLGLTAGMLGRVPRGYAESAAEFYRGQTLRFVVGSGAGGGYDLYARMLAPHLAKVMAADVVVDNRPGAGGLLALDQIYDADPDGLAVIVASASGAALAQLLGQEGASFDLARMSWIAGLGADMPVVMLSPLSSFHTLAELVAADHPVKWSASGRATGQGFWVCFFAHALGIPFNLITGYKGSNESALAAMRGEADGIIVTASSAYMYAQDGQMLPIATISHERSSLFPDLPTVFEQVTLSADAAWWMDYCLRTGVVGRTVIGPPGLPADRLAFLQDAFRQVLTDPAVVAEAAAANRVLAYQAPDFVQTEALGLLTDVDDAHRDLLKTLLVSE